MIGHPITWTIMSSSFNITREFVVFGDDWGRHPSSTQHLFARIARSHRVLWVNTLGLRAPKPDTFTILRGFEKVKQWSRPLRRVSQNLWVLAPVMLPVSGEGVLARVSTALAAASIRRAMRRIGMSRPILWTAVPTARDFVGRLGESAVVYYVTDDFTLWPGGNAERIRRADLDLTARSDLVFACTEALARSHDIGQGRTFLLPHAVDVEHFSREAAEPADLAAIPHPRACFFGLIYEKIDLPLLRTLAQQVPELHLVLIGPVKTDATSLEALPNVDLIGPRPYEQLPAYLQHMDVFLVPYVLDEESLAKGPLKIRECLAVGKPTVARSIPSLAEFGDMISLYEDSSGFLDAVRAALKRPTGNLAERMRQRVQGQTWESRVETIMECLGQLDGQEDGSDPMMGCCVEVADEPPDWTGFLQGRPDASIFHDVRWGQVMWDAYGNRPIYLTARRGGQMVGVLQLVFQKSLLFGSHLSSLPYLDSAGVLADAPEAAGALVAEARGLMGELGCRWVELRQPAAIDASLPTRTDKVTLRLALPHDPEDLWSQLKAKVRNQVRKAQQSNLVAASGGSELIDEFYAVYSRNMRDLGSPPHSKRFFRLIADRFGPAVRLHAVRLGRKPVAASFTLADGHRVCVPWAGSDWRVSELCGNMLLYWTMLADSCRRGAQCFDFGRSTRDSGTYRFKTQWGAEEFPLHWHYLLPAGQEMPDLRSDSPRFRLLVWIWKRLPVSVVRAIGPKVIAKLS